MEDNNKKKSRFRFPLWIKTLIVLILSVSIVSGVAIGFFSYSIRSITRNHYIEHSIEVADTLGLFVDLDDVKAVKNKVDEIYKSIPEDQKVENSDWGSQEWETYLNNYNVVVEMPEFSALMNQVKEFHSKNDAKYTYLGYADLDNSRLVYLVDDSPEDEWCRPGSYDDFTKSDMSVYNHLEEGFTPEVTNMPEYGYLVSVGRPIFDESHNIVAFALVDLSMEEIIAKVAENTRTLVILLASLSVVAVIIGFLLVLFLMVRPIRILTDAANKYIQDENTELNKFAKIKINTKDEIEDLSNSMKKMESDINQYINDLSSTTTRLEGAERQVDEMKYLAVRDALTGVNNKRAYFEIEERLNEEINKGKAKFAIAMIDLNDLKVTNDTLGHEKGDALIVATSELIKKIFENSDIYRVGGDEFVVVSEGNDLKNIKNLEEQFKQAIKDESNEVFAAIGVAIFDASKDNNVEDTFKRADKRMYENKKMIKENK